MSLWQFSASITSFFYFTGLGRLTQISDFWAEWPFSLDHAHKPPETT